MLNVGPSPKTSHGFDPNVYRQGLSGQNRKDFDSLGRNTKGDYSGWAKNAGFGGNTADAFNKRYKLPATPPITPRPMNPMGGMQYSHGPGSGAPPTAGPGSGMPPPINPPVTSMSNMGGGQGIAPGGMRPPMGPIQREWNMGGGMNQGGGNNMVQGPSFMQQPQQQSPMQQNSMQPDMNSMLGMMGMMSMMNRGNQQPSAPAAPKRNRMAGGMVDPNFARMMNFKASGGMGSAMSQRPGSNAQHGPGAFGVSPSLYYQHFDQQGMPLQKKQPDLWSMYQQMLGGGQ